MRLVFQWNMGDWFEQGAGRKANDGGGPLAMQPMQPCGWWILNDCGVEGGLS